MEKQQPINRKYRKYYYACGLRRSEGITKTIPSNLLTEDELSTIYQNYPQNNPHQIRNKVLLGLIIYQALRSGECIKLQVEHLNLNLGIIEVPSAKRSAKRNLQLQEQQNSLIQSYLDKIQKVEDLQKQLDQYHPLK